MSRRPGIAVIGERIREARLAAGITARQLGVSRAFVSYLERGLHRPSQQTLEVIAARTGKPVEFFLSECPPPPVVRALPRGPEWWCELVDAYLRSTVRRGRRPNTQRAYAAELNDFGRYIEPLDLGALVEILPLHIEGWQDDLATRVSASTQQLAATALRGLLRWAAARDMELSKPTLWLRVDLPRVPARQPRPIPRAHLERLLAFLEEPAGEPQELRARALFHVLFSSGCRISEALQLERDSFHDRVAIITQKGGREHALMIGAKAEAAIDDYLAARDDDLPAMFAWYENTPMVEPMPYKAAEHMWRALAKRAGVAPFGSHQLRHSCVTAMLRRHVDIRVAAKHVGHRNLQAISNYAEVDLDMRREAVAALEAL